MASRFIVVIVLQSLFFCISCNSTKKVAYFQNAQDLTSHPIVGTIEAPIQPSDILNITISSLNATADTKYNKAENTASKGYLVNNDGNIQLPTLGNIKAAGLTKKQLTENITKAILAKKELLDPIVEIRHINFEVTVLGEVNHPTVINVPSEQISLVKALGLAGDLTIYGKRDNVLLIREGDGYRVTRHINLNSIDFLHSPYYYLEPNDVVYVEPNSAKIASTSRSQQILPVVLSSISILIVVLSMFIK